MSEPAPGAPYVSQGRGAYIIFILFILWVLSFLDRQVLALLTPALKADLRLDDVQVSLLQGMAFASLYAVAGLPLGLWVDRGNRRNVLIAGVVFWSVATVACGLSTTFEQLFMARMAVGLGEACLAPATVSLVADYFHPAQRGRALGIIQAGSPVGSTLSLYIGGALLTVLIQGQGGLAMGWAPWQIVFVAIGLPGIAVAALVLTLREPPRRRDPQVQVDEVGLLAILSQAPGAFATLYLLFGCIFLMGYGITAWGPTILMRVYGVSPAEAGAMFGTLLLLVPVATILGGWMSDALARRRPADGRVLIAAMLLPIVMASLVGLLLAKGLWTTVAAMAAAQFFISLIGTTSYAVMQDMTPNGQRGKVVAIYLLATNFIGLGGGPMLMGMATVHILKDEMQVQTGVALVALAASAVAMLLALLLPRLYRGAAGRAFAPAAAPYPISPISAPTS